MIAELAWPILSRIHLGPLAISPHGIGIAIGYLAGAQLMVRRARARGGPDEGEIWNVLSWALVGAIIGARVGYVIGHFDEVTGGGDDLRGVLRIWEGGISLLGGITGAVLVALPFVVRKRMGFWRTADLAAPGLALGIVIGRLGDLAIGDHLGKATSFALGWRCLGDGGAEPQTAAIYRAAVARGEPPSLGCYDVVVHQSALYDFVSTLALLGLLLWLGRAARRPGFLILVFTLWYGTVRIATDFLRVDRRYLGLTGSQLMSLAVGLACLYLLARYRGAPPRWAAPGGNGSGAPDAESSEGSQNPPDPAAGDSGEHPDIRLPEAGSGTIEGTSRDEGP
ncbi:MAG: prolipoprotein diacylglyceryl transferase [Actinomycetota bacterium]